MVGGDLESAISFVLFALDQTVVEPRPLRVAGIKLLVGKLPRIGPPPRLRRKASQRAGPINGSDSRQFADVGDIAFSHRTQLAGHHGGHRHCLSAESHELDFVTGTVVMDMHDGARVTFLQSILRQVRSEDNAIVFPDIHDSRGLGRDEPWRKFGWRVLTVWECETEKPEKLRRRLERLLA